MKDIDVRVISTEKELKIISDPYRMKIIKVYQQSKVPLTVKGCADIMGEVPANVHYHVKKLLSIDILVLDHTEDIKGIKAKYYKLPLKKLVIKMHDEENNEMTDYLNQVSSLVTSILDDFKITLSKATMRVKEEDIKKESEAGMLSGTEIHLTEEEYHEVVELLQGFSEKYGDDGENKSRYSLISGISYIVEDK